VAATPAATLVIQQDIAPDLQPDEDAAAEEDLLDSLNDFQSAVDVSSLQVDAAGATLSVA
jgi:hypothetical protein